MYLSKGMRFFWKERGNAILGLRKIGLSWNKIGMILDMDKNNVRRTYLRYAPKT